MATTAKTMRIRKDTDDGSFPRALPPVDPGGKHTKENEEEDE